MKSQLIACAVLTVSAFAQRMTEVQIIGSHNSYHAGLAPAELANLKKANPKLAESLDYAHPSITKQLDMGVRKLELDIFSDTRGGLFAKPKTAVPDPPFDPQGLMLKPGFKVIHVQDLDFRSTCQPFTGCLAELRQWSKAHPRHLPIYVLIETKTGNPRPEFMVTPEPVTVETLNLLDAEIRSVFEPRQIITPDDVRAGGKTLEAAVLTKGWPSLESARGKVVFLFDQETVTPLYTKGHPSLEGRVIFTNASPGTPDAAFVKENDAHSPRIPELVKKGYLVRTMSDGGVAGVRANDTQKKDAALASGAQIVSTDYYFSKKADSGYHVEFADGIARCNPLSSKTCKPDSLRE